MLTNKDYCDYETSALLYALGYDCQVIHLIAEKITLYEAQKWLREEKEIHIEVYACAGGYVYELCKAYRSDSFSGGTTIYTSDDADPKLNDAGIYETYEEALLEGIKEVAKYLKDGIGK